MLLPQDTDITEDAPPVYYSVIIGAFDGGTVDADRMSALPGETVTLTITPDAGFALSSITATSVTLYGTDETRTFTMPDHDVTVTATFNATSCNDDANEQLTINNEPLKAWTHEGKLYLSGLTEGKPWHIYNLYGQVIYSGIAVTNKMEIPLPVKGIYFIANVKESTKIVIP